MADHLLHSFLSAIRASTDNEIIANPKSALDAKWIIYGLVLSAVGFTLSMLIGKPLLAWLRAKKIGKRILADGPQSHKVKSGTPTMGGLMIILSILIVAFFIMYITGSKAMLLPIGILISCGLLGAVDDLLSLVGRDQLPPPTESETAFQRRWRRLLQQRGLTARFKMSWLVAISLVAALILHLPLDLQKVYVPFIQYPIPLGWIYVPIAIILISGFSNAVNLTDGLDTLAGLTCAIAFFAYAVIGFLQGQQYVVLMGFTSAGACLGFLWYNAYPAQVFMGDTGSLTLGALLAVLAFQTNQWLLLPLIGGVFVVETISVILQVGYFKWTRHRTGEGKRLFKMSPLHNHFELSGWSENQITMRFTLLGMVFAMVGVALALL
ncbi:MAG: phospho-N-acetylmuramoyl-pentapeptide-transferase [Chloroflexota bacterium]|nr:phospho-N-acetylmuramoyl-pentapeptide-transferase [Chloroflexota bacterium]